VRSQLFAQEVGDAQHIASAKDLQCSGAIGAARGWVSCGRLSAPVGSCRKDLANAKIANTIETGSNRICNGESLFIDTVRSY